jgi:hypothetical protein
MLGRLRCKLGLHSMEARPLNSEGDEYRECTRCKKVSVRVGSPSAAALRGGDHIPGRKPWDPRNDKMTL